jgi:hypothetical protein
MNMSHDVVTANQLLSSSSLEVLVCNFEMLLHLLEGVRGDSQALSQTDE